MDNEKIYRFASDLGACLKCCLRLTQLNTTSTLFHLQGKEFIQQASTYFGGQMDEEPLTKKTSKNLCTLCLGLLEAGSEPTFINQIADTIISKGFTFNTYQLQIALPATIMLRNTIMLAKMNMNFPELELNEKNVSSVKEIWRTIVSTYLCEKLSAQVEIDSPFQITIVLTHEDTNQECEFLLDNNRKLFHPNLCKKSMKKELLGSANHFNNTSIIRALNTMEPSALINMNLDPPINPFKLNDIICRNTSIFLAGRYNKFSRMLSQTPWIVDGAVILESSVQDLMIKAISTFIDAEDYKFSSAGREDVDVRMLGKGRPFVIEIINPKTSSVQHLIMEIQNCINKSTSLIKVHDLQVTTKEAVNINLKDGETCRSKIYLATCCINRKIVEEDIIKVEAIKNLEITQKTPIRVLHRRSLADRKRTIYEMSLTKDPQHDQIFDLKVTAEAGTYIKEFVHSDFGRTRPSLKELIGDCDTDIISLDVLEISMEWPSSNQNADINTNS